MLLRLLITVITATLLLTSCTTVSKTVDENYTMLEPTKTWVVLMEMNDFPEGFSDLPIDFVNTKQMKDMFIKLGVEEDNILVKKDDMSINSVKESIAWLNENSKESDMVFFYIATHGSWLRNKLAWNTLVLPKWKALEGRKKILLVDSCNAGEFILDQENDEASGISIGAVSADELGWWGVEEEGLPIIGSIWVKYFTEAVFSEDADLDDNGMITINEALEYSTPQVQKYMKDEVFTVKEFLDGYHSVGYYPEKKEAYPNPVLYDHFEKELVLNKLK